MIASMLDRSRRVLIVLVCAVLVITGCSADPAEPATVDDGVSEGELSEEGLTLTLDGIVVTVPASAAPQGTLVRLALAHVPGTVPAETSPAIPQGTEVVSVSESISITLGDGLQPEAPISIVFPIEDGALEKAPDEGTALVMRSVSADGAVSLAEGVFNASARTFATQTDHLSFFEVFKIDLGEAVAQAKTGLLQSVGLEYPQPGCTRDIARLDGYAYAVAQPPQSWLCVSDKGGELSVKAWPNSVIPFVLSSKQTSSLRTELDEISVTTGFLVVLAETLGFIGSSQAAVMPGTTASLAFSGTPNEITIYLDQYPALLLMAILAQTIDTVFTWFGVDGVLKLLDDMQCLVDAAKVAPPGSSLRGETVGALTRAFFSCAGTVGGEIISRAGQVLLSIIASAPGFLAGAALGIVNEFTGEARATVQLDITKPSPPSGNAALLLAPDGRVFANSQDLTSLPYPDAVAALTRVLGAPDVDAPASSVCDNPSIGEWSFVRWKNFSILIQVGDNPYGGGNSRKGRIVGWDLSAWSDQRLQPSPTFSGITLGSTLASSRAAFPYAEEDEGDGSWVLSISRSADIFSGASLHFLDRSPDAQVMYMASGHTCS